MRNVNAEMLILARESRGLTQRQLADMVEIAQSAISKYENGLLDVPEEHVTDIANALDYPESLFSRRDSIEGSGSTCMYHRKRQTLPVHELRRIHAYTILTMIRVARLLRSASMEPAYPFPRYDVNEYGGPDVIAGLVRRAWRLPMGPIKDLTAVIENAGGVIIPLSFGTRKLDAISQWPVGMPPMFFINSDMPFERIRFSLAHELGHLIMHAIPTPEQEPEADEFASSFLMPEEVIRRDLRFLSIPNALQLKPTWRVSMQAIIYRAYHLGEISESKYRRLFTDIGRMGYRLREPTPIDPEEATTLQRLAKLHLEDQRYSLKELCGLLDISEVELKRDFLGMSGTKITMIGEK
ncbi:MAG: ImmA/IrrE family metallo-endopeptidase [bacterium]|nr:ImmA/IrrE family metallo-endopeptidase [bacterium]